MKRIFLSVLSLTVLLVGTAAVALAADPTNPAGEHGTITIDGVEIDFWKQGGGPADVGASPPGATPEPATLALLGAGALWALSRRRAA